MGRHTGARTSGLPAESRVRIAGVDVSAVNMDQALSILESHIERGERGYVCVSDVHSLMKASRSPQLGKVFSETVLTVPDGMPLVWAGRRAGATGMGRVCGPELLPALLAAGITHGWRSYFVGGREEVTQALRENLETAVPGVRIAGMCSPPFRELSQAEDEALVAEINAARPDIVWVGLGAPKQEFWMAEHRGALDAPLLIGVGAAFDMHAGNVRRAPLWMRERGLEWLFRLSLEPRRLWRRYLGTIPRFGLALLREKPRLVTPS